MGAKQVGRELRVLLILGAITAGGTLQFKEIRRLADENERLTKLAFEPRPGVFVPSLHVPTLEGDSIDLGKPGQVQLLFFFNTSCPHCLASLASWNGIADSLRSESGLTVLGVAFSDSISASAYTAAHGLRFRVIPVPDARVAGLFRVNAVPAVILVSRDGRMAYTRLGLPNGAESADSILDAVRKTVALDEGG